MRSFNYCDFKAVLLSTAKEPSEGVAGRKVTGFMGNVVLIFTNTCTHDGIIIPIMVTLVYGNYTNLPLLSTNDTLVLKEQVNTHTGQKTGTAL